MSISPHPHIQTFLEYLQFEKRYSRHTLISYQNDLEQFFAYLKIQFEITDTELITSVFIRSWLADLKESGLESKTITRKISSLKSFFKFQIRQGIIQQTPMTVIVAPKSGKRLPSFITEKEMQIFLANQTPVSEDWKQHTNALILLLFYYTGIRLSELINLKESQLDFNYQQIKVVGKGNKERIIPVSSELLLQIKNYLSKKPIQLAGVENVFVSEKGKPLYAKYVYKTVNDYLKQVTTIQQKSPHVLRHTFATHLANNGADLNAIKELLGHSSLAATQIYTHNTIEKLKKVFKKAHPKA